MAQTLLTPTIITKESLRILHSKVVLAKSVYRDYDKQFANSGASPSGKIGPTLTIRMPNRYTVRTGPTVQIQEITEYSQVLTVSTLIGVDMVFPNVDLTLTIDDFSKRYIAPAMSVLASKVDQYVANNFSGVYNQVGTPGTTPQSALVYLQGGAKLSDNLCPDDSRSAIIDPWAQGYTVDSLKTLFHKDASISDQYEKGEMGEALGFAFKMSQNIPSISCGTRKAGTLVSTGHMNTVASTSVDGDTVLNLTLTSDGSTGSAYTINAGDTFQIAGVNAVHYETKVDLGRLQDFVCTTTTTANGSGVIQIPVSPSINLTGPFQNVSALPQSGAYVMFTNGDASETHKTNILFHPEAFALVTADLELPGGVDMAARQSLDGISMRVVRQYNIITNEIICRVDILLGTKLIRPELACRLVG